MDNNFYKKRAARRLIVLGIVVIAAGLAYWYFSNTNTLQEIAGLESSAQRLATEGLSRFSAPPPLLATSTPSTGAGSYVLTREGVIADTNAERSANGSLPPLSENTTLDDIASLRLNDMFTKQYFAHISPSGASALTIASSVGYENLALGENLAFGNFDGDQGVLTAWMNSPGHRANILDTHYTQIGVAVGKGNLQGEIGWIAVQVFGRPASDCPAPATTLKGQIEAGQSQVSGFQTQLQAMQSQMDAMQPKSGDAYNQAIKNYNAVVDEYNAVLTQVKSEISQYNSEVNAYNQCIGT